MNIDDIIDDYNSHFGEHILSVFMFIGDLASFEILVRNSIEDNRRIPKRQIDLHFAAKKAGMVY